MSPYVFFPFSNIRNFNGQRNICQLEILTSVSSLSQTNNRKTLANICQNSIFYLKQTHTHQIFGETGGGEALEEASPLIYFFFPFHFTFFFLPPFSDVPEKQHLEKPFSILWFLFQLRRTHPDATIWTRQFHIQLRRAPTLCLEVTQGQGPGSPRVTLICPEKLLWTGHPEPHNFASITKRTKQELMSPFSVGQKSLLSSSLPRFKSLY